MPIDTERLKEHISRSGLSITDLSQELDIDDSTYYRKMQNDGDSFTIKQAQRLVEALHLTDKEANCIFFHKGLAHAREK